MTFKHVALVFALSALPLLVNCASPTEDSEFGANASTEGADEKEGDARVFSDAGAPSSASSVACAVTEPIDAKKFVHRPARVEPGACTAGDLDAILAFTDSHPKASFTDLYAEIQANHSETCASCIFGDDGETFGPIIAKNGAVVSLNASGCIEIVSGKGTACGRAHRQWDQCIDEACASCDDAELSRCSEEVQSGACKPATDAVMAACGRDLNNVVQACRGTYGWDEAIRRQCVGRR